MSWPTCEDIITNYTCAVQFKGIDSQSALFDWKKVHKRSYELVRMSPLDGAIVSPHNDLYH